MGREEIFQIVRAGRAAGRIGKTERASVAVSVRHAVDFRGKRAEAEFIGLHLARQAHGQQGPAVKRVFKADDCRPSRGISGDFHGIFNRLRAAVGKHGHFGKIAGREGIEFGGQLHVRFVHGHVKTRVNVFIRLILDGRNHPRIAVAHVVDADAARKIDEFPAIHIGHHRAVGLPDKSRGDVERPLGNMLFSKILKFLY